ncbi:MAG: WG repeat-containing protein [Parabacteroides distasonis]
MEYESAFRFEEGLAMVKKNGRYGFIDKYGKEVIPLIYENIPYSFSDGLAKVKREGKWGYVNNQGEEVVACLYDDIASFGRISKG